MRAMGAHLSLVIINDLHVLWPGLSAGPLEANAPLAVHANRVLAVTIRRAVEALGFSSKYGGIGEAYRRIFARRKGISRRRTRCILNYAVGNLSGEP